MADLNEELDDYNPDIITLEDDEGNEYSFEVIDAADFNGKRYLAVVPFADDAAEALEEDAELVIMRVGNEGDDEFVDVVEDEDELADIGARFAERLSDLYDIDASDIIQ